MACDHTWHTTSALRLVVETDRDFFANLFPTAPTLLPVEFCRRCGAVRIGPDLLVTLTAALAAVDPSATDPGTPGPRDGSSS